MLSNPRHRMDPVTHGITGALLGKAFFSNRDKPTRQVAVFAATLGAVFPDVDTVVDLVSRDPLAIVRYHPAASPIPSWLCRSLRFCSLSLRPRFSTC